MTADAFLHMDHVAAVRRFAALLAPGGTLVLMTQNPFVWARRPLKPFPPDVPHGALNEWPTRQRIQALLRAYFTIDRTTSLDPGGTRGVLWWVEHRYVRGAIRRVVGRSRWRWWLETLGLGRELVFIARRRQVQ